MNFSTLSESEISRIAEVQVYKGQYYDAARIPIEGGLLDPRMVLLLISMIHVCVILQFYALNYWFLGQ